MSLQIFGKHNSLNAEPFQYKTVETKNECRIVSMHNCGHKIVWTQQRCNANLWEQTSLNAILFQCKTVETNQLERNTVSMQNCGNTQVERNTFSMQNCLDKRNKNKTSWLPNALDAKTLKMQGIFKVVDCLPPGSWCSVLCPKSLQGKPLESCCMGFATAV